MIFIVLKNAFFILQDRPQSVVENLFFFYHVDTPHTFIIIVDSFYRNILGSFYFF